MRDLHQHDLWLGALHQFPRILHARATCSFDINPDSLQKVLVSALSSLREASIPLEITIADREGYSNGRMSFKIGIGNGDAFDFLDSREEERVIARIENSGPFDILDLVFHIHYSVDDAIRHKIHEDHYVVRLVFERGRVEVLVHHLKGIRRVEPVELVKVFLRQLNVKLVNQRFPELDLEISESA